MGAGIAIKAMSQRKFSLLIFGWAQILTDLEPLLVIITGKGTYHGYSHTYLGAAVIGIVAALTGKYLSETGLRLIGMSRYLPIRWPAAFVSAFIGTYSHVLLDSITHVDVKPFMPFSNANTLPGLISTGAMEVFLVFCGIVGSLVLYMLREEEPKN
jgi:membrane-bound metal-dependent hydrolase YbcI (DUF457 family)